MTGDRLYLAAAFERSAEVAGYAMALEAFGYQITSRWLDRDNQLPGSAVAVHAASPDWAKRIEELAALDAEDVVACDRLVCWTGKHGSGRNVEFGMAAALSKSLIVVGEPENIFHLAAGVLRVADFDELLAVLSGQKWT